MRLLGLVIEEGSGNGSRSKIFLVTEFMGKGSLLEYLRSRGRQFVTKRDQIGFAYDTCCGMAYLESRHVVHRSVETLYNYHHHGDLLQGLGGQERAAGG